jgi:hypothetical protein
MTKPDPVRLREGGSELDRALLSVAMHDRGSERARRRAVGALLATLSATKAGAAAGFAPTALLAFKWASIGAAAGLSSMVALHAVTHAVPRAEATLAAPRLKAPSRPSEPLRGRAATRREIIEESASAQAPSPVPEAAFPDLAANSPTAGATLAPKTPPAVTPERSRPLSPHRERALAQPTAMAPTSRAVSRETVAPAARQAKAPADGTSLANELALLDTTRRALAARNPARALAALAERERLFGAGVLGPEAEILRVEALLLAGDRASAERVGRAFLARQSGGPHGARMRSLLSW